MANDKNIEEPMYDAVAVDGTPIGAIAPSPNDETAKVVYAPAVFDESTGFVQRIENAMSPEAILDPKRKDDPRVVPDEVIEKLLPGYRNVAKRTRAIELYVTGQYSLPEIAKMLNVPDRTVAKWAEVGNWIQFQEQVANTLKKHEKVRLAIIRTQNREKMMKEQIELGHDINEAAKVHIAEAETASQLKLAAEAAKLGSDMASRAVGIGESGRVDEDGAAAKTNAAMTLVQVYSGNSDGLPEVHVSEKKEGVIDV